MDKEQIEKLIDNKISSATLKAKLEMSESRLKFALWFGAALLALGGVIIPMWMTSTSTQKVDRAVEAMENKFEKLAGTQLREPDLEAYIRGQKLQGGTLTLGTEKSSLQTMLLKNNGDGPARQISIQLYIADVKDQIYVSENSVMVGDVTGRWYSLDFSDEEGFNKSFSVEYISEFFLNPKASLVFEIEIGVKKEEGIQKIQLPALLKIFYGQPEPKRIAFNILREKTIL